MVYDHEDTRWISKTPFEKKEVEIGDLPWGMLEREKR